MKLLLCLLSALLFASCKGRSDSKNSNLDTDSTSISNRKLSDREIDESNGIVIETNLGTIRAQLYPSSAPVTVDNFLSYVDQGHYDGTIFHRVMPDFMIQGGGFKIENGFPKELETGDGIFNESAQTESNARGTLAMARTNDPNSATSQFFINVVDNAKLDHPNMGGYAVFGKVTDGMDVVDAIKTVETGSKMALSLGPDGRYASSPFENVPVEPVTIISIRRADQSE